MWNHSPLETKPHLELTDYFLIFARASASPSWWSLRDKRPPRRRQSSPPRESGELRLAQKASVPGIHIGMVGAHPGQRDMAITTPVHLLDHTRNIPWTMAKQWTM